MMSVFSLVSRSLRTGEPLQETLPKNLVERLFHHSRRNGSDDSEDLGESFWEELSSVEYLNYAAGVTAVFMIVLVTIFFVFPYLNIYLPCDTVTG